MLRSLRACCGAVEAKLIQGSNAAPSRLSPFREKGEGPEDRRPTLSEGLSFSAPVPQETEKRIAHQNVVIPESNVTSEQTRLSALMLCQATYDLLDHRIGLGKGLLLG